MVADKNKAWLEDPVQESVLITAALALGRQKRASSFAKRLVADGLHPAI
jgi:hypothetical protein